jgi:hypothetical protein
MQIIEAVGRVGRARKLLLLVALLIVSVSGIATAKQTKKARNTSGVIYAGTTHLEGSDLYVAGDFKDKILGRGAIVYVVNVSSGEPGSILVKAKQITIYTRRGSLRGKGEATETVNPDGTGTVSDGTFKLKKGTGAYKGHKLKGTFDGVYEDGVYTFDYKGKYR